MAEKAETGVDFSVKSGGTFPLVHPLPILHVRIGINPDDAASKDDKFTLTSDDGSYKKTLTVKDDKVDGDAFVDLVFENVKRRGTYTLEIDPGAEGPPYKLFENVPFQDLIDYYSMTDPGDELEAEPDEPESTGSPEDIGDWEDEGDGGGAAYGGDYDADDDALFNIVQEDENPYDEEEIDWDTFDPSTPDIGNADDQDENDGWS